MAELNSGSNPKLIAFYLPQFHTIPENDLWWGKGFTEWSNVEKAIPLYEGHNQPNIPLNDNYYNLLDTQTQEWQAGLARENGVFGFCYYHYWFKNGRKLLEQPAERMLENPKVDLPFCFCWANENWSRNWDGGNREIIVEQDYGRKKDWELHFQYLLPFFKDPRYITFNGKPVLLIYKPDQIIDLKKMVAYFRKRALDCGFSGLYIGYQFPGFENDLFYQNGIFDFQVAFEPVFSRYMASHPVQNRDWKVDWLRKLSGETIVSVYRKLKSKPTPSTDPTRDNKKLKLFSYPEACKQIETQKWSSDLYPGVFAGWDNTPRNQKGLIYEDFDIPTFEKTLRSVMKRAIQDEKPAIFINAWNEWGEGAFLEPDQNFEYQKLNSIKKVLQDLSGSNDE